MQSFFYLFTRYLAEKAQNKEMSVSHVFIRPYISNTLSLRS